MAEIEKDDLLADVRAADAELSDGGKPEIDTGTVPGVAETAEQKAERARDEAGRFAKEEGKPRETLKLKPKEAAGGPAGSEVRTPQPAAVVSPTALPAAGPSPKDDFLVPPLEWKGKAKTDWTKLPPAVRAEIHQDYQALSQSREAMAPVEQALAPWRDTLIRDAGSVESGISQLMQFYKLFLENPQGLIHHIARTRGIDLGQQAGQQGQQQPSTPQAPDINSLVSQAVQQAIAPIHQRFQQTETQQVAQTLDEFAADPRHPYFQDVRVDMGVLIQTNRARNLQEAYDKACRMNDTIWSTLEAQRTEEAKGSQAAAADKARRAAAASVRGSPLPNGASGSTSQTSSVLDDVRAADAELSGA